MRLERPRTHIYKGPRRCTSGAVDTRVGGDQRPSGEAASLLFLIIGFPALPLDGQHTFISTKVTFWWQQRAFDDDAGAF